MTPNPQEPEAPRPALSIRRVSPGTALLVLAFACLVCWQGFEHARAIRLAQGALRTRTRDITNSLGVILRSQAPFGFISQTRLEAALNEMVSSDEVRGIAVLNQSGEPTARAGSLTNLEPDPLAVQGEHWDVGTVTFVNLVDIGMMWEIEGVEAVAPIILPAGQGEPGPGPPPFPGEGPPPPFPGVGPSPFSTGKHSFMRGPFTEEEFNRVQKMMHGQPLSQEEVTEMLSIFSKFLYTDKQRAAFEAEINTAPLDEQHIRAALDAAFRAAMEPGHTHEKRPLFRRPPWLNEQQYEELRKSRSAHWFVLTLSDHAFRHQVSQDLRLRLLVLLAGGCALLAAGFALRATSRSSQLRLRLIRAMDMNAHLRDMNVAAAGLVHETKNPLNVMRGIAQMIAKNQDATDEMQTNAMRIAEEVDRVAGRLNQFIDYSRPLEVKLASTDLQKLVENVHRVLEGDFDEHQISFLMTGPEIAIEADEAMLRQVLFNLLLNAVQALDNEGLVEVRISRDHGTASLEISDSGPGVPPESREEIFRPYFAIRGKGTGLGLAIVRQIILAHQWEIRCDTSSLGGARFIISGMTIV